MLNPAEPLPIAARCVVCHRLSYDPREVGARCWRIKNRDGDQCDGRMERVEAWQQQNRERAGARG